MRNQPLLYLLFFCSFSYGQTSKKIISGKVFFDKEPVSDVHIVNKNSNTGTITTDFGFYEISTNIGDVLEFYHLNFKTDKIIVTKEILAQEIFKITLKIKTYELEEIIVEKQKGTFYLDIEIMPPPTVNASTLNLPYANLRAKKNDAILQLNSGAVISLSNLIGTLNGSNKRRKALIKISKEDKVLLEIRKYYTDDFFITDLNIKQKNINPFLNYCFKLLF
ncbi:MAG: hypothetical protein ACJA1B_002437 [Polaribacter sp.]|jgi:hypothetical protein